MEIKKNRIKRVLSPEVTYLKRKKSILNPASTEQPQECELRAAAAGLCRKPILDERKNKASYGVHSKKKKTFKQGGKRRAPVANRG